jgi:hypothetical protein
MCTLLMRQSYNEHQVSRLRFFCYSNFYDEINDARVHSEKSWVIFLMGQKSMKFTKPFSYDYSKSLQRADKNYLRNVTPARLL